MSEPQPAAQPRDSDSVQPISTPLLVLTISSFIALMSALYVFIEIVGLTELRVLVAGAGLWGPLLYVSIKALTFTFAPLSAGPIQFASGLLFGVIPGTFYSVLGEVLGGVANMLIARLLGRRIVRRFVGAEGLRRIEGFHEKYLDDWKSLLAARLLLFSVYDFISYGVGFGRIRLSVYITVSFFGGLGPTYIFVQMGSQAAQSQEVLLLFYALAALAFVVFMLFRKPISRLVSRINDKL